MKTEALKCFKRGSDSRVSIFPETVLLTGTREIHTATLVIGSALVLVTTVLATLKVTLGAALLNPVKYLRAE